MKAINFTEQNKIYAKSQKEYFSIPVHFGLDGTATSCWQLGKEDLLRVIETGKVFISISTFRQPLSPMNVFTENPCFMVNPLKQSRQLNVVKKEINNYYSTGIGCMIRASDAEQMIQFEEIEDNEGDVLAMDKLDKWLEAQGFERRRYEKEEDANKLGIPYLAVGFTNDVMMNSVVKHLGEVVHDTSKEDFGIKKVMFYETFHAINDTYENEASESKGAD